MEMIKLQNKDIKRIQDSLKYGDKKMIAIELGIKQSTLSMILRPRVLLNAETDRYETVYSMPKHAYEVINQYIQNK